MAPTFPDDDVDMCWQQSNITPPVLTDQAPSNIHGLAYIPDADADMCIQPIEDPLPSRYNPWNIEWSDEEDTIDPLPPAVLNTTYIVAADTEEPVELEVVPTRVPEPAGTRYKLLKEAGCKPKNPNLPRPDHLLDVIDGHKYSTHKVYADGSISWRCNQRTKGAPPCRAYVKQVFHVGSGGSTFQRNGEDHCHGGFDKKQIYNTQILNLVSIILMHMKCILNLVMQMKC